MGRRCKNCDTAQADKRLELCAACEIQFIKPSNDTDQEFAELFRHYHGQSKESLQEDIFGHERRLKLLADTAEDTNAVAHLLEFQSIIEAKKKEIIIKLLAKDVSNNVSSSIETHQSKDESFISSSPTGPTISPRKLREEQPEKIERKVDINSNTIPCSYGKPFLPDIPSPYKNSGVLNQGFNTHDEIDGCILYKDGNETGNKVVRRRSSVKDRIQAFENLHKRSSLGNSNK